MNALIKKNLLYAKRNFWKLTFQFLYPAIFIILGIIFLQIFKPRTFVHQQVFSEYYQSFSVYSRYSFMHMIDPYILITSSSGVLSSLTKFIKLKDPSARVVSYATIKDFESSTSPAQSYNLALCIIINEDAHGDLSFRVKSNDLTYENVYQSVNLLEHLPSRLRLNSNRLWKSLTQMLSQFVAYYKGIKLKRDLIINAIPMPSPEADSLFSNESVLSFAPSLYVFVCSSFTFTFVIWMVNEKENKTKDLLLRQGISKGTYIMSWLFTYLLLTLIPLIITSALIWLFIVKHVNIAFIIISQVLFIMDLFAMSFFFQAVVSTTSSSQTLLKILYIGIVLFGYAISLPEVSPIVKYIFAIFPQFVQIMNLAIIGKMDLFNVKGISWTMMNSTYNYFTFNITIVLFLVDFAVFLSLGAFVISYQESGLDFMRFMANVVKLGGKSYQKNNTGEHMFEALLPNRSSSVIKAKEAKEEANTLSNIHEKVIHEEIDNEEAMNDKKNNNYLLIDKVFKFYKDVIAVNDFYGEMYPNQIFCLLGHNGAGKTSLIKMISGLEDPDSGDIFMNYHSLVTDKDYLFKNIGLCSQEDIIFDYLTVQEHLELMYSLRGEQSNQAEISNLISRIELLEKKDSLCKTLSGGQKRKLCVALALVGNARLILLDEPTSGMDVIAKRFLWDFLKEFKKNKIIILTTHSLDEAEYLGDRIGIMSEGKFICSGSSSFLKTQYYCGYNVNLINDPMTLTMERRMELIKGLREIDGSIAVKISSKNLLVLNFMGESGLYEDKDKTREVFEYIDKIKKNYGIFNYTVSTTSLEDVFLKINHHCDEEDNIQLSSSKNDKEMDYKGDVIQRRRCCLQLCLNLKRNLLTVWRNKWSFLIEIIVASFTVLIYIFSLYSLLSVSSRKFQSLDILLEEYPIYLSSSSSSSSPDDFSHSYLGKKNGPIYFIPLPYNLSETDCIKQSNELFSLSPYKNDRALLSIKENSTSRLEVNIIYNSAGLNYLPTLMNVAASAFFHQDHKINVSFFEGYSLFDNLNYYFDSFWTSIYMGTVLLWNSFICFSAYLIYTPLKERLSNIQQLLYLSGVNKFNYWLALFISDLIKFFSFLLIIFPFLIYLDITFAYILLYTFVFLLSLIMFNYVFSFAFDTEANGQKHYLFLVYLMTALTMFVYLLRSLFNKSGGGSRLIMISENDLFPISSFLWGLIKIASYDQRKGTPKEFLNLIAFHSAVLFLHFVLYGIMLVLCEKRVFRKWWHKMVYCCCLKKGYRNDGNGLGNEDDKRYQSILPIDKARVTVKNLSKTYWLCCRDNVRAINRLNMSLENNEKFGLLGFNGSGKTTVFKAITNELIYDQGSIKVFNHPLPQDMAEIKRFIGYCPQKNTLFSHMTVLETINYYKALKQVTSDYDINDDAIYKQFGLEKYFNVFCSNLSGGNKRKLTFAIAIMNSPSLILLDEPSTGVDPESRRAMWRSINKIAMEQSTNMILSTHSMEEAEVLSDTVGWLKQGSFICIGNPEQLKLKESKGYHLHIKFKLPLHKMNEAEAEELRGKYHIEKAYDSNESVYAHYKKLDEVIEGIRKDCGGVTVREVGLDYSFELLIEVIEESQGRLFGELLTLMSKDKEISEVNIKLQSLEKIMTRLEERTI